MLGGAGRVQRVVDEVGQHAADFPGGHQLIVPLGGDGELELRAALSGLDHLRLNQRVDRRTGGAQHVAHALHVAVDLIHVGDRLAGLVHLNQAVDDLQVIHEVVPLGAHLAVEALQLAVGLLQLLRLVHQLQAGQRRADVRHRAPAHDGHAQQRRHAGERSLHADAEHPVDQHDHGQPRDDLQNVKDDGDGRRLLHLDMAGHIARCRNLELHSPHSGRLRRHLSCSDQRKKKSRAEPGSAPHGRRDYS